MLRFGVFCLGLALIPAACTSKRAEERIYPLHGQVLSIEADRQQANIKHDEIKGLMMAMTMPYKMKDAHVLDGVKPGDVIDAQLVLVSNDAYLSEVKKTGEAPLETPPAPTATSAGVELLKPGDAVPNATFIDESGKKRGFEDFKGSIVAVTFIYTKCPLPTFCPLMDRHFAQVQKSLKSDPALKQVHLVSVSFDPLTDTPPVLLSHARELNADPQRWTFFTGERDSIDQFAARFGVFVTRAPEDPRDITHNLRTAIIDAEGKVVKVYIGNDWTPSQLLKDLKAVASRA